MVTVPAAGPLLSLAELRSAQRALSVPFQVDVQIGTRSHRLQVLELLRLLPGRRLAARALWADTGATTPAITILLKLFLDDAASRYCEREYRGYELLQAANLPTPECVARGDNALLYQWLDHASPVADTARDQVEQTIEQVGQLHRAGLLQTDMHLENFLWRAGNVWLIDPDGIRAAGSGAVAAAACRDNLALLCAQLPPLQDIALAPRLMRYCRGADLAVDGAAAQRLAAQLPQAVVQARTQRINRYLDKSLRDCTEFLADHTSRQRFVCLRSHWGPALERFRADPEAVLQQATVLKAGNTATVLRVEMAGKPYIVKRYNVKSTVHRLRQSTRRRSRAERAWCNGHRLRMLRIPTALPIALLEHRRYGLRDVAYLLTEDLGTVDLLQELRTGSLTPLRLQQVVALFEALKLAGLRHGDTKATNLLVHSNQLYLIDLDSMRPSRHGARRDRLRFVANWPETSPLHQQLRAGLGL